MDAEAAGRLLRRVGKPHLLDRERLSWWTQTKIVDEGEFASDIERARLSDMESVRVY